MRLSAGARKAMPTKDFALPGKRHGGKGGYPIEDKAHARNALSRVSQFGTPAEKAEVRAKVHAKYPGIGGKSTVKSHDGHDGHDGKSGFMKRGHFETHAQKSSEELSHSEFSALDHGKHDHMPSRKTEPFERGNARVGFLVALLAAVLPALAIGAAAISPVGIFGGAGTFVQLPGNIPLVFTAAPTSTSATLASNWTSTATSELVVFSDGEVRTVTLANAATTASWTGALLGAPTVNAIVDGFTTPPGAGTEGFTSDFGTVTSTGTYWTWSGFQDATPVAPIAATITGCGTVTAVKGGATTGTFTAGQTSCVPVIYLPYSPNGWYCSYWDITTNTDTLKQTASTTTTCTGTGTVVNADVLYWQARGF
jgi:hypothetical protein